MISVGFPGTVASLRQQWGRAGRRGHGLAVLVATEDALDQYFMREPDKLLGRRVEAAILDHANPRVLAGHVRAAAYEAPIDERDADDPRAGGARGRGRATRSCKQHAARLSSGAGTTTPGGPDRRSARPSPTRSRSSTRRPARCSASSSARAPTRPCTRAPSTSTSASPTSSRELDETTLHAVVEPFRGDWYTQPKKETDTTIVGPLREERRLGLDLVFGEIEVTEQVVGYERKTIASQERIELVPLELPALDLRDRGDLVLRPSPSSSRDLDAMPKLLGDAARRRARADRDAAALGDVRPLGHRRPLDEPPPPTRAGRRSSSTTATPAASGSPSAASSSSRAGSPTRRG